MCFCRWVSGPFCVVSRVVLEWELGIWLTMTCRGGNQFEPIVDGNCVVPQNLEGEVYMMITKSKSVADEEVLAGPSVIQPS